MGCNESIPETSRNYKITFEANSSYSKTFTFYSNEITPRKTFIKYGGEYTGIFEPGFTFNTDINFGKFSDVTIHRELFCKNGEKWTLVKDEIDFISFISDNKTYKIDQPGVYKYVMSVYKNNNLEVSKTYTFEINHHFRFP